MIRTYAMRVRGIADDYNWETDALEALVGRSVLEERWEELTNRQRAEVSEIDDGLVQQWRRVAKLLPTLDKNPPSHWWWFLHEGPQVRQEAEKTVS
ncbi:MAG: hypothetical protein IT324_22930 [Anaerolineae bacterium]|nr:hypothetical protein [Anaerolineae bacterium]